MSLFDVTFLQSTLTPVASGLTVKAFQNAAAGMTLAQATAFAGLNTPAATGVTDLNGHTALAIASNTLTMFLVGALNPAYTTTPLATSGPVFVLAYPTSNLCAVTGIVTDTAGSPQAGVTVTANLNATGPVIATNLVLAKTVTTTTDGNGHWSLSVIPNDLITNPKETLYTFVFTMPAPNPATLPIFTYNVPVVAHGASVSHVVEVPNVNTIDFGSLL